MMPFVQSVSSLMTEMAAVLDLHSGPAVLEAAARTYLSLCGDGAAWAAAAAASRDSLVQRWVDRLTETMGASLRVGVSVPFVQPNIFLEISRHLFLAPLLDQPYFCQF